MRMQLMVGLALALACGSAMAQNEADEDVTPISIPTLPGKWLPEQAYPASSMEKCLQTLAGVADMAEKDPETEKLYVLARDKQDRISDYFIRVRGKDHVVSCIAMDDQTVLVTFGQVSHRF